MKLKCKLLENEVGKLIFQNEYKFADLPINEYYTVEIRPYRTSRSLEQNAMLWALMSELADKTGNDVMDVYISALEQANAKYTWIATVEEAENSLKKCFRAVKPFGTITTSDNKTLIRYKCWIGSSKFDTAEMGKLIDYVERTLYYE